MSEAATTHAATTAPVGREAFVAATRGLPELRITEVVLQTARWEEMKDWYTAFLGVEPYFETDTMCFRRVNDAHGQLLVLFRVPGAADAGGEPAPPPAGSGLNHVQFKAGSLREALERHERLQAVGIAPTRSYNHGPSTALYYRDPDGNTMEISGPNFPTEAEYRAYMQTDAFRRNPRGVPIDPAAMLSRLRAGAPQAELIRIG